VYVNAGSCISSGLVNLVKHFSELPRGSKEAQKRLLNGFFKTRFIKHYLNLSHGIVSANRLCAASSEEEKYKSKSIMTV